MAGEFSPRALTTAVNLMKTAPTRVLDVVFGNKKRQMSDTFSWDVKTGTEGLLANIRVTEEATVRGGIGRKNLTCKAPRYASKELITAAELNDMRKFGDAAYPELLKERIAEEQFDMKQTVDLTREFQACKALSGQVVDKDGTVIVDYNLPAAHKPTLTGTALWTDAASDPIGNIRAWKKLIGQNGGPVTGFAAFCGSLAMTALINNKNVRELLGYQAGQQIAETGGIARLAGVANIEEYFGSYLDSTKTRHDLIPEDVFALVGLGPQVSAELYAPVVDLKAPGGVGKGKEADIFFSKMWEVEDPSGQWIKVESRPLPVFFQPLCVVWGKVV
ncbi:MAG: major capsid protein [Desulfobulbus sp.]